MPYEAGVGLCAQGHGVGQRAARAGLKPCPWKASLWGAHSQQSPHYASPTVTNLIALGAMKRSDEIGRL